VIDGSLSVALASKVVEGAVEGLSSVCIKQLYVSIKRHHRWMVKATPSNTASAVKRHIEYVSAWAQSLHFRESGTPRRLSSSFVDLDLQVTPRSLSLIQSEPVVGSVSSLAAEATPIALLGDVGAGKTTSLKYLITRHLSRYLSDPRSKALPILLELKSLKEPDSIATRLLALFGVNVMRESSTGRSDQLDATEGRAREAVALALAVDLLNSVDCRLFLDGLDEVPTTKLPSVVDDIRHFALTLRRPMMLTCRSAAFDYAFDNIRVFELRPLTPEQIRVFVARWLGDQDDTETLLRQLKNTPYQDTAVRPLALSHLCALFQRYRTIPATPKTVYRKIFTLLLEDWDLERSVSRASAYADFNSDRKQEFLERLAYLIRDSEFSHEELEAAYRLVCGDFGLPRHQADRVAREIESHTGLVCQAGYGRYSFAHKSLHEYLTADYLVRCPSVDAAFEEYTNELAIAVSLSTRPCRYFAAVVFGPMTRQLEEKYVATFLQRILWEKPDFGVDAIFGIAILFIDQVIERNGWGATRNVLMALLDRENPAESARAAFGHFAVADSSPAGVRLVYRGDLGKADFPLPDELCVSASLAVDWMTGNRR
jgi:hypothetical protein